MPIRDIEIESSNDSVAQHSGGIILKYSLHICVRDSNVSDLLIPLGLM